VLNLLHRALSKKGADRGGIAEHRGPMVKTTASDALEDESNIHLLVGGGLSGYPGDLYVYHRTRY